jgi:hypothetical protein
MLSKELKSLIERFKLDFSKYNTQAGALYQCCDATAEFMKFVNQVDSLLISRFGIHRFEFEVGPSIGLCPKIYRNGLNEMGEVRADWHSIVGTKNVLIDWTARQYVETAPFPLLIAKRGLHIRRNHGDFYTAIRLSHPAAVGIREEVAHKRQQGYVWHVDIGWQPPVHKLGSVKTSYAAVGHGG